MRTFNCKLKDKSYELYFDNRALYEFENVHGDTATKVFSTGEIGFRALTHFVYAGLLHLDNNPTLDEVINLIPTKSFEAVSLSVAQALNDAFEDGEDSEKNPKADHQE